MKHWGYLSLDSFFFFFFLGKGHPMDDADVPIGQFTGTWINSKYVCLKLDLKLILY